MEHLADERMEEGGEEEEMDVMDVPCCFGFLSQRKKKKLMMRMMMNMMKSCSQMRWNEMNSEKRNE